MCGTVSSLPVRGAWVEMRILRTLSTSGLSRSPCGERGLKLYTTHRPRHLPRRSPCGERGLKFLSSVRARHGGRGSLPVRGAWVEILLRCKNRVNVGGRSPCGERGLKFPAYRRTPLRVQSLPVRGAWVEIDIYTAEKDYLPSLPVRGAWVEIEGWKTQCVTCIVAPRAGSVG